MGVSYLELYELTPNELVKVLTKKREQLAYEMWKQANLIGSMFSKKPPKTFEEASPELFPKKEKPRIIMPSGLRKQKGGK